MPGGRPSEYKPEYCERAIEYLSQGYSVFALAGELGVSLQTIYNWRDRHPEFLEALKIGQAGAGLWWEQRLRKIAAGEEGNATATIFGLKNRAREVWSDVTRTEHAGHDGGAVQIVTDSPRERINAILDAKHSRQAGDAPDE